MKIQINTKVPTDREFRKLDWPIREAKRFEMIEASRKALIMEDLPEEPVKMVALEIGSKTNVERLFIRPIIEVLRSDGFIADDCSIVLRTTDAYGLVEITL